MKLTMEIKDEKFIYEYEFSGEKIGGSMPITYENFLSFCNSVSLCRSATVFRDKKEWEEMIDEMKVEFYLKKHPEIIEKAIKDATVPF